MEYELALKLKKAGFENPWCGNLDREHCDGSCFPTLEKLIEACGDKFDFIMRSEGDLLGRILEAQGINTDWAAGTKDFKTLKHGATPTEAVANLYLALHENK